MECKAVPKRAPSSSAARGCTMREAARRRRRRLAREDKLRTRCGGGSGYRWAPRSLAGRTTRPTCTRPARSEMDGAHTKQQKTSGDMGEVTAMRRRAQGGVGASRF